MGALLAVGGVLATLFGLLLIAYEGDTPDGDPYMQIVGAEFDADVVGAVVVALSVAAIVVGVLLLRRRSRV